MTISNVHSHSGDSIGETRHDLFKGNFQKLIKIFWRTQWCTFKECSIQLQHCFRRFCFASRKGKMRRGQIFKLKNDGANSTLCLIDLSHCEFSIILFWTRIRKLKLMHINSRLDVCTHLSWAIRLHDKHLLSLGGIETFFRTRATAILKSSSDNRTRQWQFCCKLKANGLFTTLYQNRLVLVDVAENAGLPFLTP